MENALRRFGISGGIAVVLLLLMCVAALAVPALVTNFSGYAQSSSSIYLTWTPATSSNTTVIRYSTVTYPATPADGTSAYSGTSSYTTVNGLTAGTTYYFAAWGYDSANYSAASVTLAVTTLPAVSANTTLPYPMPTLPPETFQNPTTGGWSWAPFDSIIAYFADPSYTHGGLGMPADNLIMFLWGLGIAAAGIITYVKWRNFWTSWVFVFILSCLASQAHVMQAYVVGLEILVGMGVWAVEHNFQ